MVAVAAPRAATAARAALRVGHVALGSPPPMLTEHGGGRAIPRPTASPFTRRSQNRVTEFTPRTPRCPYEGTIPQTARHSL